MREDFRQLSAAAASGEMKAIRHHAHRMRGAMAHAEDGEEIVELCRELELGAAQALAVVEAHVDNLALYLAAYFDDPESDKGSQDAARRNWPDTI
ncbi:hypothetical protein D3C87_1889920 [compost metagenome]